MSYRRYEIYISNEVQFYAGLRKKQLTGKVKGSESITIDEVINGDLRNLWTTANPEWIAGWEQREEARQRHKKELERIENEALSLSPEAVVNHVT